MSGDADLGGDAGTADQPTIDELWRALQRARDAGDADRIRAFERRLRERREGVRFGHLDDAELDRRIAAIRHTLGEGVDVVYSDGHGGGSGGGDPTYARKMMALNDRIREDAPTGDLRHLLDQLLQERARRVH